MDPRQFTWPGGRKVAVMITAAVELWSEGHWPSYAPMAGAWPLPGAHDAHSTSWSEYGAKTGVWRLLDVLDRQGMTATFGVNGLVAERFPAAVHAISQAGHEIAAHSYAQDVVPALLDADEERANIARSVDLLHDVTGHRPTGWMSPRATSSARTADLLAQAGFTWSGDFNDRELPYVLPTAYGPLVAIMHSDFSDVRGAAAGPRTYRDVHQDLLRHLLEAPGTGILNLTVHAHVGGRPLLSSMFDQILTSIRLAGDDVRVTTHQRIAEHVLATARQHEGNRTPP
ncbi:polysaccharide deacetylase family protein [Umezawaea sp. Da 62-37]|uniref:polysaccharide deacetylase family protein n=1 Tax=Umezawaea sp. Da 62-37 TaxID=3075927 RepID=UPI0028F6ECB6|nr:polysaccharide deacetylase family protein [Umezawaea sp. Da 62-37]WNV86131.1 polysaccharide deacetylase family protein [Umezawaea sp. Da 62-37]